MKRLNLLLFIFALLVGCATTKNTSNAKINNNSKLITYNSYQPTITLEENKELLNRLKSNQINFDEYSAQLKNKGRISIFNTFIEDMICATNRNESYQEVIRADFFIRSDSLMNIAENQLNELTKQDSSYAIPYFYLSTINYYINQDFQSAINLVDSAIRHSVIEDKYYLSFYKAKILEKMGDYIGVIAIYENIFLEREELIIDNWKSLFYLYININELDKAESLFYMAENISLDYNFIKKNLIEFSNISWLRKDYKKMEDKYITIKDSTNSEYIDNELFNLSIMQNKFNEAKKQLLNLSSIDLNLYSNPNLTFPEFDSLDVHYSEVLSKLKHTIDVSSNNSDANFCYGFLIVSRELNKYYKDIDDELVRKGLAFIKKSNFSDSEINYIIGFVNLELDNQQAALEYFSKIQDKSKYYPYSLINRAIIIKEKNIDSSISLLIDAEKILSNKPSLIEKIGDYYYSDLYDYDKSVIWYKRLLSMKPDKHLRRIWLSNSYLNLENTKLALSEIDIALDNLYIDTDTWTKEWLLSMAYKTKGDIYKNLSNWQFAQDNYKTALKYFPSDNRVRLSLGNSYLQLNKIDMSEKIYLAVVDSVTGKENIKDYEYEYFEALQKLNLIYSRFKENPSVHINLFKKAVEYFPNDDWSYRILGIIYNNRDLYTLAKESFNKAIDLNPSNYYNFSSLSTTLQKEGNYDKAIENYVRALKLIEENKSLENKSKVSLIASTNSSIANAYFDKKEYRNAIKFWDIANELQVDFFTIYNLGLSYLNLGGINNLHKSNEYFIELIKIIENKSDYIELKNKSLFMIESVNYEIGKLEWPQKIEKNLKSNNKTISLIAKIYKLTDYYRELNNMFLDGVEKTTPEYSESGGYINGYNVSSKIFQSESLCDRFKSKISLIDSKNDKIIELKSLWSLASETRKDGIKLYSQGYYVKAKDYSGEYERGRAKIDVANQYYVDGLKILKSLMQKNIENFSSYGIETINDMIKYYEHKE